MSDLSSQPNQPRPTPERPVLSRQRCFNHAGREAAARCPECEHFYCRECITEHEGRVICASCLARLAARASSTARPANGLAPPEGERRRGRRGLAWVGHGVRLAAAILVLWFFFYGLGRGLLLMPDAFHEGVLWQRDLWYEE